MNIPKSLHLSSVALIAASSLSSCVVTERPVVYRPGPRPVVVERDTYVDVLPRGARVVTVRGERCWLYNGRYYRRHPHRHGYVVFVP